MTLKERIQNDIYVALKQGDRQTATTLRLLMAAIKDREIALKKRDEGLSDQEVVEVLQREIKKRRDSIEAFTHGSRQDLADKEVGELQILAEYLPPQMSEDELKKEVMLAIQEAGASSPQDVGSVMKALMSHLRGKIDGKKAMEIATHMLEL